MDLILTLKRLKKYIKRYNAGILLASIGETVAYIALIAMGAGVVDIKYRAEPLICNFATSAKRDRVFPISFLMVIYLLMDYRICSASESAFSITLSIS